MEDGNWILECDDTLAGDVVLPSSYNGTPITKIYANAFEDCDLITSIVVPEGILEIQDEAFKNCTGLISVTLPESLDSVTLGNYIFDDCTSLSNVILPQSMKIIPNGLFSSCSSLTDVNLPENLELIETGAFRFTGLTSFTVPQGVTLDDFIFSGCSDLAVFNFSDQTYIPAGTFYLCRNLTSVLIPDTVTSIGSSAFGKCASLQSIDLPDSITKISRGSFYECTSLQSINLPDSITNIENAAFYGCTSLQSINLPSKLESLGLGWFYGNLEGVFEGCNAITKITIPKNLIELGKYAFRNCSALEYAYFEGDNHFASSEFPFLGSNPKIYFNENTNGWDNSPFSLVWEMIEKPVARVTFNSQINEMELSYEEVSQNYVLYSSDSLMGPYTPVEDQSIQVTTGANGQITKVFNDTVTTSKFYKLVLNLDDYHSN